MLTPMVVHDTFHAGSSVAPLSGEGSSGGGWVPIADAALFLHGELAREGDALVIISPEGDRLVVADYFVTDPPPILSAPNGAFLLPETVALLLPGGASGLLVAGPVPEHAVAAGEAGTGKVGGGAIGKVKGITGAATARSQGGESHDLQVGQDVFEGEELKTADGGQVQLLFLDGTQFQLGPGARVVLDKFVYNPAAAQGEFGATVLKGAFAYASGDIAHQHPGRHSIVKTPTAQIGIRGSALQGEVADNGQTTVVHTSGVLDIADAHGQGTVTLLEPGMATVVTLDGSPQPAFHAPQAILDRLRTILPPVLHDHKPDTSHDKSGESHHQSLHEGYKDTAHDTKPIKATLGLPKEVTLNQDEHGQGKENPFEHLLAQLPPVAHHPAPTLNISHGIFLDSAVAGVQYRTASQSGVTDSGGGFAFKDGETVTFSVGNIILGTVSSTSVRAGTGGLPIVTLDKLADTVAGAQSAAHANIVTNIARLLQTLDSDGNPANGITITQTALDDAAKTVADVTAAPEQFSSAVTSYITQATHQTGLIDAKTALANYNQTILALSALDNVHVLTASMLLAVQDQSFHFTLPQDTFLAPNGATLSYTVSLTDGTTNTALPAGYWLHFDPATLTLSGTPHNADVGDAVIKITATYGSTNTSSGYVNYLLMVDNVNDVPVASAGTGLVQMDTHTTSPSIAAAFTDADVSLSVGGKALDSLTYTLTSVNGGTVPGWLSLDPTLGKLSDSLLGTSTSDGMYTIAVTATDAFGAHASKDFTLFVNDHAPTRTVTSPAYISYAGAGQKFDVAVAGDFQENNAGTWDHLTYSASVNGQLLSATTQQTAWSLTFDPVTGHLSGMSPGTGGDVTVTITATDLAGQSAAPYVLTLAGNFPPVATTAFATQEVAQPGSSGFSLNIASSSSPWFQDPHGDPMTYTYTVGETGSTLPGLTLTSTGLFSGSGLASGRYQIHLTATDTHATPAGILHASDTQDFTLYVDSSPPVAPTHLPAAAQSVQQGSPFTLQIDPFTDPDSAWDKITCSVSGAPAWLQFDPKTLIFSGTPTNDGVTLNPDGSSYSIPITLTATDLAGETSVNAVTFNLTVTDKNDAPVVIHAIGDRTFVPGAPAISFANTFTDPDLRYGDKLTYTATLNDGTDHSFTSGTPLDGLTFDADTFTLSGTPTQSVVITVTAHDSGGLTAADSFTLKVDRAPTLVSANPLTAQTATQDASFSLPLAAHFQDPDLNDALTYSATLLDGTALPGWLHINSATGLLSGTPAKGDVGGFDSHGSETPLNIKVTATDLAGAAVSGQFALTVADVNAAPTTLHALPGMLAPASLNPASPSLELKLATVQADFSDADRNIKGSAEHLTYTATLMDGTPLPSWLHLGSSTDHPTDFLYGTPTANDVGLLIGVEITATDSGMGTIPLRVADDFLILVTQPDNPPTKGVDIGSMTAQQGKLFLWELPSAQSSAPVAGGAEAPFYDTDLPNDQLTYTAQWVDSSGTLINGGALPTWLKFDSDTHTFIGTPGNADVTQVAGALDVRITATDWAGMSVQSNIFQIGVTNVNDAPVVAQQIANQTGFIGQSLAGTGFSVADNFNDMDKPYGDHLTFAATLVGGASLPGWLQLNASTGLFSSSGTLTSSEQGTYNIKVTATDTGNLHVSDIFSLTVRSSDHAPVLDSTKQTTTQTARQDQPFTLALDKATFTDVDAGDVLTWTATLSTGAALPAWLVFDGATQAFVGTPRNADVGPLAILVTATDKDGQSATEAFSLVVNNVNDAPTLTAGKEIPNQHVTLGAGSFSYTLASGTFTDLDMAVDSRAILTLSATQADGTPLPTWLHFDPTLQTFYGTPPTDASGTLSIKVTATDNGIHDASGAALTVPKDYLSAADMFNLTINHAPTGPTTIPVSQAATQGQMFYFKLPAGTFQDADIASGDHLTLSATQADGSALPSWLIFNASTGTLVGTPGNADVGTLALKVTATDTANAAVSAALRLVVDNVNDAPLLVQQIADQLVQTGHAIANFSVQGNFADPDLHASGVTEHLTYAAALLNGGTLAANGLSFDTNTATFSADPTHLTPTSATDLAIKVTATDLAGAKVSDVFTLHVLPPIDPPGATAIANRTATQDSAVTFQVKDAFSAPSGDLLKLTTSALPGWLHFDADTGTFFGTPGSSDLVALKTVDNLAHITTTANQAALAVTVTATDATDLRHQSVSETFTLTLDNTNDAPTVSASATAITQTVTQGSAFQFVVPGNHFTDVDALFGDTLTYSATLSGGAALPDWLHFEANTGRFYSAASATDNTLTAVLATSTLGPLNIRLTATDSHNLSVSDTVTINILPPNHAPTVAQAETDQTIHVDSTWTYHVPAGTFADADTNTGDTLTYAATAQNGAALPGWLHFDPATQTFFGTPVDQVVNGAIHDDSGVVNIKVTATDSHGATVADVFALTVTDATDHAPVLVDPVAKQTAVLTAVRGTNFQLQLDPHTFLDPDKGDTLTWSATTPGWLAFDPDTLTFSGTPDSTARTTNITLTATDAAGLKGYDVFTLNVVAVNHAPVLGSVLADQPADQTTAQGAFFHYQFAADAFADPDGDALHYSMSLADGSALPTSFWLHFDPDTRTFSGQPGNNDVGTLGIKLTATDPSGASVADILNIVVHNINDAPTVAHPIQNQSAVQGTAFTYQFAATTFADIDAQYGDTLTYTATDLTGTALPSWLHFDPTLRTFTGTPGSGDTGTINIKVTATDSGLDNPLAGGTAHPLSVSDAFSLNVGSQSGTFLDSKVIGVTYTTTDSTGHVLYSGLTDSNGAFLFDAGDTVTFAIGGTTQTVGAVLTNPATAMGGIALGQVLAGHVITPADLAGSDNVPAITNMLRLLQTLDTVGTPADGITISATEQLAAAHTSLNFNLAVDAFAADPTVIGYLQAAGDTSGSLVSTASAWQHFLGTLASIGSDGSGILTTSAATPLPVAIQGTSFVYQLSPTLFSGLSGTVQSFTVSSLDGTTTGSAVLPKWPSFDVQTGL
ncbi:MAG: putative Ig domain-containing protein, partial [Magnetococcales bacterium]|nr:putative Ig domain-containing protein [Magnetococcales bacterium]